MRDITAYWDDLEHDKITAIHNELKHSESRQDTKIIPWDEFFMSVAIMASKRSPDAQTKIGAVLVNPETKAIVSTGYNGFIRGARDDCLPNLRPDKYIWMIHAEHNAILNCARLGHKTDGCVCYVTHYPCKYCLQYLYQVGIQQIKCMSQDTHIETDGVEFRKLFHFVTYNQVEIQEIKVPDTLLKLYGGV